MKKVFKKYMTGIKKGGQRYHIGKSFGMVHSPYSLKRDELNHEEIMDISNINPTD